MKDIYQLNYILILLLFIIVVRKNLSNLGEFKNTV